MGNVAQGVADKRNCDDLKEYLIRAQRYIGNCNIRPGLDQSGKINCISEASKMRNAARENCNAKCGYDCPLSGGKRKSKRINKKRRSSRRKLLKSRRRR